jgi:N-acetylneuraminic acid mutarotase
VGGYTVKEGRAMKEAERFSYQTQRWERLAEMKIARINPGVCSTSNNYIYVFGGRSLGEEFYDTIERFNIELNLWSILRVKMPYGLCNLYCFTFQKEDRIVILGGLKKKQAKNKILDTLLNQQHGGGDSEIDKNVYMFNTFKEVWYKLRPIDTEQGGMKVAHAVSAPESNGKIFIF